MKIDSKDITIRPLSEQDSKKISEYGNNRKIWRNLTNAFPSPYTEEQARKRIRKIKKTKNLISLGIVYQNELVGELVASFRDDVDSKKVFIAYWIGQSFWNKGIVSKSIYLFCKFLFKEFEIKKIQARVFSWNKSSMRVLEKNGFSLEGVMRKAIYKNNRYCDEYVYGLLKSDLRK